ncbi:hypothetical protein AKJ09_10672 [Labilithrix luteola]|uniref:DoxX-like family protein n=1 Tax=Labilithrix luteola TaxID=1391654 RepID=A0A0K1QE22_9BACT|nr:DoxX family protein [Labilithrix luteola]AKV04009.1 hypothetical protein AKJ09_10672 [Labilithrix luteola]
MKRRVIGYWVATAIIAFVFASGGLAQLVQRQENVEGLTHLGYPVYVATILGGWKLLGAVALLVPGFPRLKEWAYAGMVFELTGASASQAFAGDGAGHVVAPLVLTAIVFASWALRPESRMMKRAT